MWLLPGVNVPVFIEFTGTLEILRQFDAVNWFDARNMAAVWAETSMVTTRVILLVRIILWYTQTTTACVFNKQYYYY